MADLLPIVIITLLLVVGFGIVIAVVRAESAKRDRDAATLSAVTEWLKTQAASTDRQNRIVSEALRGTSQDMTRAMRDNSREINERLDTAARYIGDLKRNLGEMSELGRGIRDLQEFLQSPKLRGNLGEAVLSDMLGQAFPRGGFHLQYSFRSGAKVDAAVKTGIGLLPIDAKFPMANFTRMHKAESAEERAAAKKTFAADVRKHINDIATKYILPEEGTADFALMYVPSESVYYEVAVNDELVTAAREARVYPVSPNTLYAHLQLILVSFQGKELELKSREVFRLLSAVRKDFSKTEEQLSVLGRHVTNAYNAANTLTAGFALLGQKLQRTEQLGNTAPDAKRVKGEAA